MEAWCREFALDEVNPLSHATVSKARDAFGQLLVMFNREDMTRYTDGIAHGFVIVRHLYDEATMRLRSQLSAAPADGMGLRPFQHRVAFLCMDVRARSRTTS